MGHSAKLVQKHARMQKEAVRAIGGVRSEAAAHTESAVAAAAAGVAAKLKVATERGDGLEAEHASVARELAEARAALEGLPLAVGRLMGGMSDGWNACEVRLLECQNERDKWKARAAEYVEELDDEKDRRTRQVAEVQVRAACDVAALRGELASLDRKEIKERHQWQARAQNLQAELTETKAAHVKLVDESKIAQLEAKRDLEQAKKDHVAEARALKAKLEDTEASLAAPRTPLPSDVCLASAWR